MAEKQEPGFEIAGQFYPLDVSFNMADPRLIKEVTGLSFAEFADALEEGEPEAVTGLLAVSIWRKNPTKRREWVVRFLEQLDMEAVTHVGMEDEEEDSPPAIAETASLPSSANSTNGSTSNADSTSETPNLVPTGTSVSPGGPREPSPTPT